MKRIVLMLVVFTMSLALAQGELRTPQEAALEAAGGEQIGGTVSVLGVWGGSEQESFLEMVAPFEEATGIDVEYTGTRDLNAVLFTRVEGGNPPDLAGLPGPGQMAQFARAGELVDLSSVLDMETFGENYAQTWAELGSVDGTLSGIFIKAAVKGLIWHNVNQWEEQGWEHPETWDEMMQLSQQIAEETGTTPWCVAVESGAASGWPGTDWIEDIVLRQAGPEAYDAWYQGELAWTSDEIRSAWETWGQIVGDQQMVYGGPATVLTTNFGQGGNPLFTDPVGCYMFHQASFITSFFQESFPDLQPVEDYNFFAFPKFSADAPQSVEMAGDLFGMFNDTPQARALINYLVTPEAQAIWVENGGAISPNQAVPLELYPDPISQQTAELLTSAEVVRFDASDLMPEAMNNAFWEAILEFIQNPSGLDGILENLDSVQQDAYAQ
ncbi:MAG TPA: ABC transporter substrate-binding protein [Trueperaceae bacterium]